MQDYELIAKAREVDNFIQKKELICGPILVELNRLKNLLFKNKMDILDVVNKINEIIK